MKIIYTPTKRSKFSFPHTRVEELGAAEPIALLCYNWRISLIVLGRYDYVNQNRSSFRNRWKLRISQLLNSSVSDQFEYVFTNVCVFLNYLPTLLLKIPSVPPPESI